jgi:chromosome segregation protein
MRLKHLELQGYKTFASKTEFAFDDGITAIVGPNGSGKSNIADAVRWVLGEQSYSLLRARRTEDMIFSGSETRARSGMAQATIVLDNSSEWLPVAFSEVTISRRAYRSGENEYLINGSRVRLRDTMDLLASSGLARRTYTVIGQGLVDTALALRPEERRTLFEEAAGITLHRARRAEALDKLAATEANLVRLQDIIAEIAPRLARLEQQAARAQEHAQFSTQLEKLLRIWYAYNWQEARQALRQAELRAGQQREALETCEQELRQVEQRLAEIRQQQRTLRRSLEEIHAQSSALHGRAEALQRELAVAEERRRLLSLQQEDAAGEIAPLQAQAGEQRQRIARTEARLQQLAAEREQEAEQLAAAERELQAQQQQRAEAQKRLESAQQQAVQLSAELADRRTRISQVGEQRTALAQEMAEQRQELERQQAAISAAQDELAAQEAALKSLLAELAALEDERAGLEDEAETVRAREAALQGELAGLERQESSLRARLELLSRMHEDLTGYQAGVRFLLQAARHEQSVDVWGTVASLLRVPPKLEKALEAALSGHLQDVVLHRRADLEAAITLWGEGRPGRVTILTPDSLHPPPRLDVPAGPGVLGLAADMVQVEAGLEPVVAALLNRTLVVESLEAARRLLRDLSREPGATRPGPFQLVTLGGELLESSGLLTVGAAQGDEGGFLAREREWRELPALLANLEARREELLRAVEEVASERESLAQRANALAGRAEEKAQEQERLAARRDESQRRLERLRQERAWKEGLLAQAGREMAALAGKEDSLNEEAAALEGQLQAAREDVAALQRRLSELDDQSLRERLGGWRTSVAVIEQSMEDQRAILAGQRESLERAEAQVAARRKRIEALAQEGEQLTGEIGRLREQDAALAEQLAASKERIEPVEQELADGEKAQASLEEQERRFRARLRQEDSGHSQAVLELERRQGELQNLRRQIEEDLGLVELDWGEVTGQPPLPLRPVVSALPMVKSLPEGIEDDIYRLRLQIRRLGPVNSNAPLDYAEALERQVFLQDQVADLQQATLDLRQVVAELDRLMEQEFDATFAAVADEFAHYFKLLFGGGTGKLVLTDPANLSETGVEIVARPPGRRTQSLALLSGGERALTAAALIFAFLKTRPTPFCILDEVDAMLDEANVGRFRDALAELARQTQFIVITHNRTTVESASTIYGVSMGGDSASRVVSLKLEELD